MVNNTININKKKELLPDHRIIWTEYLPEAMDDTKDS
jgi:hypothetical protein